MQRIAYAVLACVLILVSGCSSDNGKTTLQHLATFAQYDATEEYLVKLQFAVDSIELMPAFGDHAIDRIYSFPVGSEYGTLYLEFDSDSIIQKQVLFCAPECWQMPVPDTARSSAGTLKVFEGLAEYLDKEFGQCKISTTRTHSRYWSSGIELTFDSSNHVVVLDLAPSRQRPLPWMLKSAAPITALPSGLHYGDPHVIREVNRKFAEYLFGPDTMLGVPGVAYSGFADDGQLQAHIWNSIIGVGSDVFKSMAAGYESEFGPPTVTRPHAQTWWLDSGLVRIVRIDSLTVYSIFLRCNGLMEPQSRTAFLLSLRDLAYTQLAWCSEFEGAESHLNRRSDSRKRIFSFDRFIKPKLKLCEKMGETRPLKLNPLWED